MVLEKKGKKKMIENRSGDRCRKGGYLEDRKEWKENKKEEYC